MQAGVFCFFMFSCIHFPIWPYPPVNNDFYLFYTGKLYGLTGMLHRNLYFKLYRSTGPTATELAIQVCFSLTLLLTSTVVVVLSTTSDSHMSSIT